jgi:hypothetical protein
MANKHRKVWKVVSRKMNSGKQTWPYNMCSLACYIFSFILSNQFNVCVYFYYRSIK